MSDKPEVTQAERRAALIERIGTFADLLCSEPLPGASGDVAYDLLRQAAAQIASDQLHLARHRASQSESDAVRELVEALERFALIKAEDGDDFSTLPPEVIVRCEIIAEDLHIARAALTRYRGEG